ncbi:MAG TPA: hypothetical protein DCZ03_03490 [Gammaproteobacteria bacterium]|nr:hypothetical protein [Gammaproteobacteria bacterium]
MSTREKLRLLAGYQASGEPVYEQIIAQPKLHGLYKLLHSPAVVLGLASGDIIRVADDGQHRLVVRSGNLCVQLFSPLEIHKIESFIAQRIHSLRGEIDGVLSNELVSTFPFSTGFKNIENFFNEATHLDSDASWNYGNVYNFETGKPLNWWLPGQGPYLE